MGRGRAWIAGSVALGLLLIAGALLVQNPDFGVSLLRAVSAKLLDIRPSLPGDLPVMYAGVRG
ncbi:hypothetical protein A7A08_02266 [Methyloligella halotolerans]|uniref:Uncharacterized protein n=1 Tax=Methyloligella halotolerans TaxID=1177755 RepID=A0A1E2RY43_9HYPH|nr:hypothetical protein [Methyloligella halotolerans]ODA66969.1 hypothetical protein A7A08_02266 [Methyloligella halotolerans]